MRGRWNGLKWADEKSRKMELRQEVRVFSRK